MTGMSLLEACLSLERKTQPEPPAAVRARTQLTLIDHACRHGALPLDSTKPRHCTCWDDGSRARALLDIDT